MAKLEAWRKMAEDQKNRQGSDHKGSLSRGVSWSQLHFRKCPLWAVWEGAWGGKAGDEETG